VLTESEMYVYLCCVLFQKAHNLSLPGWVNQTWKDATVWTKLMWLKDWGFALLYKGRELSRLKGGE
jgi:hypothetical protein